MWKKLNKSSPKGAKRQNTENHNIKESSTSTNLTQDERHNVEGIKKNITEERKHYYH